jgi:hypothetical protein
MAGTQPLQVTPEIRADLDDLDAVIAREDARRNSSTLSSGGRSSPAPGRGTTTRSSAQGIDIGLVSDERRAKTRAYVDSLPPVVGFLVEMLPPALGTALGALFAGPLGAIGGGLGIEAIMQDLGVSPKSDVGLILAGAGPVAGRVTRVVGKGVGKIIGGAAGLMPPSRVALARKAMKDAAGEFESLATEIIGRQMGLMKVSASRLYTIAENAKVQIPAFRLSSTKAGMDVLRKELSKMRAIPEVRQAVALLDDVEKTLAGSTVSFAELLSAKEMIGKAIGLIRNKTSKIKGARKQFFKAVMEDIDHLAGLGGKTGNVGKIAQAAGRRAKLDFAIKDLQQGVDNFTTLLPGKNILVINVKELRKWFRKVTSPDNKQYNENMTKALGDEVGTMHERLRVLSTFGDGSPGGLASLIIRGKGAAVGGAIGLSTGIPGAGTVGILAGAASPEMATAIFSSTGAMFLLEKAARLGSGTINWKTWETIGQVAAQGIKQADPQRQRKPQRPQAPPAPGPSPLGP